MRLKVSKNIFIDGTFHHPPGYYQLLIIMYKDIITSLKIPAFYILLNSKKEELYDIVFESIINNILKEDYNNLNFETIVTDQELALINSIKKFFPNTKRISCLFHYKQDILRNLKKYGLYKQNYKAESDIIVDRFGLIPLLYKGDMKIFNQECDNLCKTYPRYHNFINNYFIKNKKEYFEDNSLDYSNIPKDCRTNSFLENYNGFIKSKLGKYRITNWVNFMNFLKEESQRSIDKLYNATSTNLKNKKFSEQIIMKNPFLKQNKNISIDKDRIDNKKSKFNISSNLTNKNINSDINIKNILKLKIGLINLGNTCYMNSALQIILHTDVFINKLIEYKNPSIDNITNMLINMALDIVKIGEKDENAYFIKSYFPAKFRDSFVKLHSIFNMGQQDSIEFIRFILSDISKETNKSDSNYQEFIYTDLSKNLLSKNFHENFLNYENSIITDIYYVQLINIFTCSCGKESFSFQKLLDIPLLIPTNCRNITLKKLIENFSLEIKVNLNDSCLKCHKKKENIKKQIKFDMLNEIIIFSLQRIDPVQSIKNTSFI